MMGAGSNDANNEDDIESQDHQEILTQDGG